MWSIELSATPELGRDHILKAIDPFCDKALVFVIRKRMLTLQSSAINHNSHDTFASRYETRTHIAAHLHEEMSSYEVQKLIERAVGATTVGVKVIEADKWSALVDQATEADLDIVYKGISEDQMSWKYRLWFKIVHENLRSWRAADTVFDDLMSLHAPLKTEFSRLKARYYAQKNKDNPRRVDFATCTSAASIDNDIQKEAGWIKPILDWFAQRLEPEEFNRRTLYIHGPAGVGKTRLIERLLEGQSVLQRDCCEPFFLQGLTEDTRFVWLDEFVPDIICDRSDYRSQFNKLTGREVVSVRVKNGEQYEVDADSVRTIITSNDPPMNANYYRRRMFIVHAPETIYGKWTKQDDVPFLPPTEKKRRGKY